MPRKLKENNMIIEETVAKVQKHLTSVRDLLTQIQVDISIMLKDFEDLPVGVTIVGISEISSVAGSLQMQVNMLNSAFNTYNPPVMPTPMMVPTAFPAP